MAKYSCYNCGKNPATVRKLVLMCQSETDYVGICDECQFDLLQVFGEELGNVWERIAHILRDSEYGSAIPSHIRRFKIARLSETDVANDR